MGEDVVWTVAEEVFGVLEQQLPAGKLLLQGDGGCRHAVVHQVDPRVAEDAAEEAQLVHHQVAHREEPIADAGALDHHVLEEPRLVAEDLIHPVPLRHAQPQRVVEARVVAPVLFHQQPGRGHLVRVEDRLVALATAQQCAEDDRQPQPFVRDDVSVGDGRQIRRHGLDRLVERLRRVEVEADLPAFLQLLAGEPPSLPEMELIVVDHLAGDASGIDQDHLMLGITEAPHTIQQVHIHALLDRAQPSGERLRGLVDALKRGIDDIQTIARRGQPLHLFAVPGIERTDHDGAAHGRVVGRRAEQAIEHSADAADLEAGFVGGVNDQGNAG